MRPQRSLLWLVVLGSVLCAGACQGSPEPETPPKKEAPPPAAAQISWPAVSSVLDGTDLIDLQQIKLVPFAASEASGQYSSEQGGSMLSLSVRLEGSTLQVERRSQEPGDEAHIKQYQFATTTSEGAVSAQQDAFLRQTSEGLLLLEQHSEVDTIPASYWVHYIRQK